MAPAHPHLEILENLDNIVNISTNTPMQCNYPGHFVFFLGATEGIEENLTEGSGGSVSAYRHVGACGAVGLRSRATGVAGLETSLC